MILQKKRRWFIAAAVLSCILLHDALIWTQRGRPCLPDDEGSWSIGLFTGPSPLNLTPIEATFPRRDVPMAGAWPLANPILTCASITDVPSNFVADPFIFAKSAVPRYLGRPGAALHIFFETKSNVVMRGEIGVAESIDGGITWRYLGVALSESWHLSYPHVFSWQGDVYMMPEGYKSGSLRLYKAVQYPLKWELEVVMMNRPLVDASIVEWEDRWYLFASDPSRPGHKNNAELEIFHADTPRGPWTPHFLKPIMSGDLSAGARMGGRILQHNGKLYRFGQDCRGTYGKNIVAYRINTLTPNEFDQTRMKFTAKRSNQGIGAWNGVRRHHLDALQLGDGSWLAVMDGDRQESGPLSRKLIHRAVVVGVFWLCVLAVYALSFADEHYSRKRGAGLLRTTANTSPLPMRTNSGGINGGGGGGGINGRGSSLMNTTVLYMLHLRRDVQQKCRQQMRWITQQMNSFNNRQRKASSSHTRAPSASPPPSSSSSPLNISWWWPPSRRLICMLAASVALLIILVSLSMGPWHYVTMVNETPTALAAFPVNGTYSAFTVVIMSFALRINTLRTVIDHYSRCPSVVEVVVVWNGDTPPEGGVLRVRVPVRVRLEGTTSLNNRFKPDPLLTTRAVLSLDDDILLSCADVEAAFLEWRLHPEGLVGFLPRLLSASPAKYLSERETLAAGKFNALLTGAVFLDGERWFAAFWADENAAGREMVDARFNCEDVLMNFVVAKHSSSALSSSWISSSSSAQSANVTAPLRFVRPKRRLDISAAAGLRLSKGRSHKAIREECIDDFTEQLFHGEFPLREVSIENGGGGSLCWIPGAGCLSI